MPSTDVAIEWSSDQQSLIFTFPPMLTKEAASAAIEVWDQQAGKKGREIHLVWNCSSMKDYEPAARILWQDALKKHKKKIGDIWLVSGSRVIRTAAKILAMFVELKIKPVRSMEEVPLPAMA